MDDNRVDKGDVGHHSDDGSWSRDMIDRQIGYWPSEIHHDTHSLLGGDRSVATNCDTVNNPTQRAAQGLVPKVSLKCQESIKGSQSRLANTFGQSGRIACPVSNELFAAGQY